MIALCGMLECGSDGGEQSVPEGARAKRSQRGFPATANVPKIVNRCSSSFLKQTRQ